MADYELIRNAKVDVTHVVDDKKNNVALITIDNKHQHRFSHTSRVSHHLDTMTATELSERLTGGHFFFVEDQLVDWRDGSYAKGFMHDDNAIAKFMDIIGFEERRVNARKAAQTEQDTEIILARKWSDLPIEAPHIKEGGIFSSRLIFEWSPFVRTINSTYELVRQICTNGMVGTTAWMNNKVPVINRWEEHLQIANDQVQQRVKRKILERLQSMTTRRASIADCSLLEKHAFKRATSPLNDAAQRLQLERIKAIVGVERNLGQYYKASVFDDKAIASQCPSHLTQFDVYNLATEMSSHTNETADSSNFALQRQANFLMFDENRDFGATRYGIPKVSHASDPSVAFFGALN